MGTKDFKNYKLGKARFILSTEGTTPNGTHDRQIIVDGSLLDILYLLTEAMSDSEELRKLLFEAVEFIKSKEKN